MKLKPRVGFVVIRHPLEEGGEKAPEIFAQGAAALRKVGLDVIEAPCFLEEHASAVKVGQYFYDQRVPVIVLAAATWSADPNMLDMLAECDVPIVTWGLPGMNTGSMCGCQQFCYVLKELGKPYRFVFGEADDANVHKQIAAYTSAVALAAELRKSRFGLVGYRVPGMTEVSYDEIEMKATLGPRTIHYGLETVEKTMHEFSEAQAMNVWQQRMGHVKSVKVKDSDLIDSMRGYLALRKFATDDALAGMAIECYPMFMGRLCTACSLLADEDVVVACEADMNSAVAMKILTRLTGSPVHNTDPLGVDMNENWIVYSHCGNGSVSLAESPEKIEIANVRLMHQGTCVLFPGKPGPVTLVNLCGRRGTYRMGVAVGEAIPTDLCFAGNPTKVVIENGVRHHLDKIAEHGLGHHWMIGYGDVRGQLSNLCEVLGIPYIAAT